MSVTLRGGGYVDMHPSSWQAVREIARECGCVLQYTRRSDEERGPGD
jgi:hypothetical protein